MNSVELVKSVSAGNISDFQSGVQDEVLNRLRTRIEEYKQEIASSVSDNGGNND